MSENIVNNDELYIYDVSKRVLESLELLYFDSKTLETKPIVESSEEANLDSNPIVKNESNRDAEYYKSDLHRYNLKRSLQDLPPITADEFDKLIEQESIESLSGSDSELSEVEEENEGSQEEEIDSSSDAYEQRLQSLIKKLAISNGDSQENDESTVSFLNTKSPFILFKSSILNPDKTFGIYKSMFTNHQLVNSNPLEELKLFTQKQSQKSALFMIGGGHFAGAIISHTRKLTKGNAPNSRGSLQEQAVNIIVSKTFHRYTTRRKQGGSQSASDNARGKANSAGSSIRRYNEQALIQEVRELIAEWKDHLNECDSIFIRANGAANKKILVGYEGAVLANNDPRIRSFPFTTKRATTSELKRAWVELTYLKVLDMPKVIQRKSATPIKESSPKPKEIKSKEQIKSEELSTELVSLLKKQKAPKLISFIKQNKIDINDFQLVPKERYTHTPTLLHFASANGLNHMVQILLINLKANPTVLNNAGRTPAEVAATGESDTKKVFQIVRHKLGEAYCDWKVAKVGPAKSKEEIEQEEKNSKEQIKLQKQKLIQEELAKKTELELKKPRFSSLGTLGGGGGGGGAVPVVVSDLSGLSEQQKMRMMREQRARAAEARLKGLQK